MSGLPLGDKRQYHFTGDELAHELAIEYGFRVRVYGRQVRDGKKSKKDAERKMAMMEAVENIIRQFHLGKTFTVDHKELPIPPPESER